MKNKLEALQVVKTVRRDAESKKGYDLFKKIYNLKINEKIKENNENQIRKASNKSRAMWKIIKPAKGKSEEEKRNLTAGEWNEYLAGVGQSTAEEVDQTSVSYADYLEDLKPTNEIPSHLKDVKKMRDYFSYDGQKTATVDGDTVEFFQCNKMEHLRGQSLTFRRVSEEDVINALGRIKSRCMGIDGIS
ncbi:hypothetical protein HHI36_018981 [Cryptolaemus montrouzieri]|uniref:Uncharacterized protein n=1 Tax=Cryptolaemus montrouzieri TaxID=559131 RepID=A0ABD2P1K8_9CUCU